jgi:hypothetical protein
MPVVTYTSLTSTTAQVRVSGHRYFELCSKTLSAWYMEPLVLQYSAVSTRTLIAIISSNAFL